MGKNNSRRLRMLLLPSTNQTELASVPFRVGKSLSWWSIAVWYCRPAMPPDVAEWFQLALAYPGIRLLGLTPEIALESTRLPGPFHRDPADQIIVAAARIYDCVLVTSDDKIVDYAHVETIA